MKQIVLATCVWLSFIGCKKEAEVTPPVGVPPVAEAKPAEANPTPSPAGCNSDFSAPLTADTTLTEKCSPYSVRPSSTSTASR